MKNPLRPIENDYVSLGDAFYKSVPKNEQATFGDAIRSAADVLGVRADWLSAIMYLESGYNPQAVNSTTQATGLIQFMPATAAGLATSVASLKQMTRLEQMPYVVKYLEPYKGKMNSFTDMYLAVFYPAYLGKSDNTAFPAIVAQQNPYFLKFAQDGNFTLGEWKKGVKAWFSDKGMSGLFRPSNVTIGAGILVLGTIIVGVLAYRNA